MDITKSHAYNFLSMLIGLRSSQSTRQLDEVAIITTRTTTTNTTMAYLFEGYILSSL